ncbi:failed axon connections homolog [Mya arenaria]|uniref:failed axon connections homolog n=1 Tax=Mya arenaria TaxID=6604 RepID=UPI0022E113FD|nr:failed axon connections homolog [Mya arenaria]
MINTVSASFMKSSTSIPNMINTANGSKHRRNLVCGLDYPRDIVVLHSITRDRLTPNLGHFSLKLDTYLRVNAIPYSLTDNYFQDQRGKFPWIENNGVTMGDSQFIIQYLEKEFTVNLNSHLSPSERALAWAIQKWLEVFTYWLNVYTRWVILVNDMFKMQSSFPAGLKKLLGRKITSMSYAVGICRNSNEEVHAMMANDLKLFLAMLGDRKYVMGDRICDVDCAAFGILSQVCWCTPSACPGVAMLQGGELNNVTDYIDRIKNEFWPDGEEKTSHAAQKA